MRAAGPIELPPLDCTLCPRLAAFRQTQQQLRPQWFNAPVPPFGDADAALLVVGLAPGLRGANRTGRPFTGDYAGDLLYNTLGKFDLAAGTYDARADDNLVLRKVRVTNAVRCVPPQNKPEGAEIANCRRFLAAEIGGMPGLRAIVALGAIAHQSVLAALSLPRARYPFGHGNIHSLPSGLMLADSYHCSRLNTNTGKLTAVMFESIFAELSRYLAGGQAPRPDPRPGCGEGEGPADPRI